MRARFGVGGGVDTNAGGAGSEQNNMKNISLVKKKASNPGAGGLRVARGGRRDHRQEGFGRGARRERARGRRARRCR
eukprot:6780384-Prymnesium_polylepis.1